MQHDDIPDLNPGIRKLVKLLRSHGFKTTDSGDGETHLHACDREYGYVVIHVEDPSKLVRESHRLESLLASVGIATGVIPPPDEESGPFIQANYSPGDGFALLDLSYVHDRMMGAPVQREKDGSWSSRHRKRVAPIPDFHVIDRSRVRHRQPDEPEDTDAVTAGFLRGWMEFVQDECEGANFAGIGGVHMRHDPHVPTYIPEGQAEEEWVAGYLAAVFTQYGEGWADWD